jgi:benzoyl-CoA reductase/2-hydroxyglutaryl-CoA dehydratase subunit BcrC/BadD/HgdB
VVDQITNVASPLQRIKDRLALEPSLLAEAKSKGQKVIGYFCPYVPEELILAANMLPIRLVFGGEIGPATAGEEYLKPYSCPFSRSCVGYQVTGDNTYHNLVDAVCVAQTCENMKHVQEYMETRFGKPVFRLGLPHTHDSLRSRPQSIEYFTQELKLFKKQLGDFGGQSIKRGHINQAILLCNNIRDKLRLLYEYPEKTNTLLDWYDAFYITQAGFLINRHDFLRELSAIEQEIVKQKPSTEPERKVRILIMGSVMGIGDHKILDLIHTSGGKVVTDNLCTGISTSRKNVTVYGVMGDTEEALAERYLYNVPCPCMTDLDRRLQRTAMIIQDYEIAGIIYYNLKYCDNWRTEFPVIKEYIQKELKTPMLLIESDYSPSDVGTFRTKIEAFIEMIRGI